MKTTYNLHDNVISEIAKLVQIGLLTGTDVVDNLRQLEVTVNEAGQLDLTDEYLEAATSRLDKMQSFIETVAPKQSSEV
jgi:hypothetical protein